MYFLIIILAVNDSNSTLNLLKEIKDHKQMHFSSQNVHENQEKKWNVFDISTYTFEGIF
jgi:hypothetical protein